LEVAVAPMLTDKPAGRHVFFTAFFLVIGSEQA
jgi:hypothetical protein